MKNPQLENGHLKIANEIADFLCHFRISGEEWLVLWVILRKTYGWNKKDDNISLSTFCNMTLLKRSSVVRALKKLLAKRIVTSYKSATSETNMYSFNKHLDEWAGGSNIVTPSSNIVQNPVTKVLPSKDNIQKTTIGTRFTRPSVEQVSEYCKSKHYTFDPEAFIAYYDSNGWKVGKNPMKCWKAACTTWQKKCNERNKTQQTTYPSQDDSKKWMQEILKQDMEKLSRE